MSGDYEYINSGALPQEVLEAFLGRNFSSQFPGWNFHITQVPHYHLAWLPRKLLPGEIAKIDELRNRIWAYIPSYRLEKPTLEDYLARTAFPGKTTFMVELRDDLYQCWVPSNLSEDQMNEVKALRDMDRLIRACEVPKDFPRNDIEHRMYEHIKQGFWERLNERDTKLFADVSHTGLDILEYDSQGVWRPLRLTNAQALRVHLDIDVPSGKWDPQWRCFFLHARHSREPLEVSREMCTLALAYHQVMPVFLDFFFPLGDQWYAQDLFYNAFRHDTRLSKLNKGFHIPQIGRSGRTIQLCYGLKSVERYDKQPSWPWSIRHAAIYLCFDVDTGHTTLFVLKGNDLLKRRLQSQDILDDIAQHLTSGSNDRSFCATLLVHSMFCDWAAENWRWYLNSLDDKLQELSRPITAALVESPNRSRGPDPWAAQRNLTGMVVRNPQAPPTQPLGMPPMGVPLQPVSRHPMASSPLLPPPPPPPPPPLDARAWPSPYPSDAYEQFPFKALQDLESLKEKVNSVLLSLETDVDNIENLSKYYSSVMSDPDFPDAIRTKSQGDLTRFNERLEGIRKDLKIQSSRAKSLLDILNGRKELFFGVLEYGNMEASKRFAAKAQDTADNMEEMTKDMHVIARKTKQETVAMRVITLVTLFFLPGTFVSTLFSTDIIHWDKDEETGSSKQVYQWPALRLFLIISFPLMVVTFGVYVFYWVLQHKEKDNEVRD